MSGHTFVTFTKASKSGVGFPLTRTIHLRAPRAYLSAGLPRQHLWNWENVKPVFNKINIFSLMWLIIIGENMQDNLIVRIMPFLWHCLTSDWNWVGIPSLKIIILSWQIYIDCIQQSSHKHIITKFILQVISQFF